MSQIEHDRDRVLDRVETRWFRHVVEQVDGPEGWRYPRLSAAVAELRETLRPEVEEVEEVAKDLAKDEGYAEGFDAGEVQGYEKGLAEGRRDHLDDRD